MIWWRLLVLLASTNCIINPQLIKRKVGLKKNNFNPETTSLRSVIYQIIPSTAEVLNGRTLPPKKQQVLKSKSSGVGALERSLVAEDSDLKNQTKVTAEENRYGNSTVMERMLAAADSDTKNKSIATAEANRDNNTVVEERLLALDYSDLQKNETIATAHNKKDDNVAAMERSLAMDDSDLQSNEIKATAQETKDNTAVAVESSLAAHDSNGKNQTKLTVPNKKEDNGVTAVRSLAADALQENEVKATAHTNKKDIRPVSDDIQPEIPKTGFGFDNQVAGPFDDTKGDNKKLNIANSSLTNNIAVILENSDIANEVTVQSKSLAGNEKTDSLVNQNSMLMMANTKRGVQSDFTAEVNTNAENMDDLHDIGDPEVSETVQEDVIRELVKQRILARLKQNSGVHQTVVKTSNLVRGETQGDLSKTGVDPMLMSESKRAQKISMPVDVKEQTSTQSELTKIESSKVTNKILAQILASMPGSKRIVLIRLPSRHITQGNAQPTPASQQLTVIQNNQGSSQGNQTVPRVNPQNAAVPSLNTSNHIGVKFAQNGSVQEYLIKPDVLAAIDGLISKNVLEVPSASPLDPKVASNPPNLANSSNKKLPQNSQVNKPAVESIPIGPNLADIPQNISSSDLALANANPSVVTVPNKDKEPTAMSSNAVKVIMRGPPMTTNRDVYNKLVSSWNVKQSAKVSLNASNTTTIEGKLDLKTKNETLNKQEHQQELDQTKGHEQDKENEHQQDLTDAHKLNQTKEHFHNHYTYETGQEHEHRDEQGQMMKQDSTKEHVKIMEHDYTNEHDQTKEHDHEHHNHEIVQEQEHEEIKQQIKQLQGQIHEYKEEPKQEDLQEHNLDDKQSTKVELTKANNDDNEKDNDNVAHYIIHIQEGHHLKTTTKAAELGTGKVIGVTEPKVGVADGGDQHVPLNATLSLRVQKFPRDA